MKKSNLESRENQFTRDKGKQRRKWKMSSLYKIDNEILECVDADTGEIFDEERFNALSMERDVKLENIALWIKNLKAEVEALKNEKEAFAKRQKSAENKMESLKNYLSAYLEGNKFETTKVKVSFRASESVKVDDIYKLPEEYIKYKEPDVDKVALKKALKEGKTFEGVRLEASNNIQIR